MGIGNKIKTHRKALGLNQTELGEKVGVKKNAVSKWECGRVEGIPISTVKALASLFGVTASYLIDDDIPEVSSPATMQIVLSTDETNDNFKVTESEMDIIKKYRDLDNRGRAAVLNTLYHEHSARTEKNTIPAPKEA